MPLIVVAKDSKLSLQFDKEEFYNAISAKNIVAVNKEINILKSISLKNKEAFEGTLLMKKAGLVNNPREKLQLFKEGRKKLEAAISKEPDNVEFRFLRFIIQENTPRILNYKTNLEADKLMIVKNIKDLPIYLQQVITDYSKTSKLIHPKDFEGA